MSERGFCIQAQFVVVLQHHRTERQSKNIKSFHERGLRSDCMRDV